MKINNLNNFVLKHIGGSLVLVGAVTMILQFCGLNQMFPLNTIIFLFSLILQFIGWNEPWIFLLTKKEKKKQK